MTLFDGIDPSDSWPLSKPIAHDEWRGDEAIRSTGVAQLHPCSSQPARRMRQAPSIREIR